MSSDEEKGLFQRNHEALERAQKNGKVGEKPFGLGQGERPGLGGRGGGQDPDRPGVHEQLND